MGLAGASERLSYLLYTYEIQAWMSTCLNYWWSEKMLVEKDFMLGESGG